MTHGSTLPAFSRHSGRRQTWWRRGEPPRAGPGNGADTHPSDSLPSIQAIQTAAAVARQWSGWREIVPCDGLMARLHDACCSGARFNFYPQSITTPGKNSLHAGGGCIPPSPLCIRPWFFVLICHRFVRYGPSYKHCCRALTLALARFSWHPIWYMMSRTIKCYFALVINQSII